ncbi:hypothetical protein [Williamsia sp. D3]|uniref:hypothetical protein n=1 Tax=Williamsia sp. D3 TaxID=1313067 RepID=UPI0003D2FA07|nr:hypothetical protein [Williamsia sp. D3]ETD31535.1 hypothetical protein W823_19340 [Williamsia sp. D3]
MLTVRVRGAGEPVGPNQMLAGVTQGMSDVIDLDFRPEIRPIGTLRLPESVVIGRAALRSIDALGRPWKASGFSLGAYILGEYVMLDRPKNLKGIVLLADPLRARNQIAHGGVPTNRFGLAGERFISGVPVHSFAIPDDPISSCPADNGLRLIANGVTGRRQPDPARWWDAFGTIEWAKKYLIGGRHNAYGSERMPGDSRTYVQAARDAWQECRNAGRDSEQAWQGSSAAR